MKHQSNNDEKMPRMSRVTIEDSNKSATLSVVRLAWPAFVRLEWKRNTSGISRWVLKPDIIRRAVGAYFQEPGYILDYSTA